MRCYPRPRRSDRDNFAPRRERFLCLRRPHFFQQRKKWGKERRQKLRFCTSSARCTRPWFPASSRGHSPLSPLSDKRTACTFTGAEAPATACPRHGRCFSLLPPHLPSLSLERRTPDSLPPGGCGVEWRATFPLGGRWRAAPDEVFSPAGGTPNTLAALAATCQSRPRGGFDAI